MRMPEWLTKSGIPVGSVADFPEGSVERAKIVVVSLLASWSLASSTVKNWQWEVDRVKREGAYTKLGFPSFDEMLRASIGKGEDEALAEKTKAQELANKVPAAGPAGGQPGNQNARKKPDPAEVDDMESSVTLSGEKTNLMPSDSFLRSPEIEFAPRAEKVVHPRSLEDRIKRLKRDRPDLNALVASGELTLPDAERQAGIDPRGRRLWLPVDPVKAAALIKERFGDEFARRLGECLDAGMPE